jgi:hypothetical protein
MTHRKHRSGIEDDGLDPSCHKGMTSDHGKLFSGQECALIDLDDGVKQNYPKFGNALAKVPGLS